MTIDDIVLATDQKPEANKDSVAAALEKLDAMVGLTPVKQEVRRLTARLEVERQLAVAQNLEAHWVIVSPLRSTVNQWVILGRAVLDEIWALDTRICRFNRPIKPKTPPYLLASPENPAIYRPISHGSMAVTGRPVATGPQVFMT